MISNRGYLKPFWSRKVSPVANLGPQRVSFLKNTQDNFGWKRKGKKDYKYMIINCRYLQIWTLSFVYLYYQYWKVQKLLLMLPFWSMFPFSGFPQLLESPRKTCKSKISSSNLLDFFFKVHNIFPWYLVSGSIKFKTLIVHVYSLLNFSNDLTLVF